jgi:anaerobic selenocysteine-containing dehydrogenase
MRFMASYGSPNLAFTPSAAQTWALACVLMLGHYEIGFDLEGADYVVSFGTPLFEGFGAPVATRKALSTWKDNDVEFVQVEPRASVTAGRADTWLACKPGTEGAVALGIASVMVKEGAYDKELASKALGFEDDGEGPGFKALLLNDYTPEKVSAITGVPKGKLLKVAKTFAKSSKALAVCGPDNSGDPGRLYDFMAVLALNMLKGNLGKEGGLVARQALPVNPLGEHIKVPAKPRLDGGHEKPLAVTNLAALAEGAIKGDPYKPGAVIIVGSNPLFSGPQANVIRKMLDQTPLVVAITPYMDETAQLADVVLPAKTFLESWGDSATPYGSPVSAYGIHKPLIAEPGEAKATGDCLLALAKVMGGEVQKALDFDNMEKVLKTRCADMGDFRKLAEKGYWVQEKPLTGDFYFATPSGKPEFKSSGLAMALMRMAEKTGNKDFLAGLGIDSKNEALAALPHYQKPQALAKVDKKYPLLMAGIPSLRTAQASRPASPYMMKILSDKTLANKDKLVVEINPATAKEFGLTEGEAIVIESASGEIQAIVHLFEGAAPGMVFVPMGLGHTAFGEYLKDKGDNFQKVVLVTTDAMSGLPQWGLSPVRVKKAKGAAHV